MALSPLLVYTDTPFWFAVVSERKRAKMMPWREIKARTVARLARTRLGREAMVETASLSPLLVKPTLRVWAGLGLIVLSYIIGWPAVGLLALIAFHTSEPMIVAIGGPLVYGLSHLVFIAGFYLAGSHYAPLFLRWVTRKTIEKMGGCSSDEPPIRH
jgi:hypothetical protein